MSQAEIGSLRVRLGIDTAEFANGVKSVQGALSGLKSAMAGFASAFAVNTIFDASVAAMKAVAEIGDVAESIGVSAEQLQAFNKMAIASGTSTDILTRGLQSIAEQSVSTESKLSKLFEANGLTVKGKQTNQIIREFMDLVKNAATPTEQLAIITDVLGDKVGRQLVEAFRNGADGVDEATRQMIKSGEFHTNAEVKRLQDIETEYNKITERIATRWQQMIVGIATGLSRMQQDFASNKPSAASELWRWLNGEPVRDWDINTGQPIGSWSMGANLGPVGLGSMNFGIRPAPTALPPSLLPPVKAPKLAADRIIPPGTIEDIYGAGKAVTVLQANFQDAVEDADIFSEALASITDTIAGGLSNALSGLLSGTMSVSDAFRSMADTIINGLADIAASLITSGLQNALMGGVSPSQQGASLMSSIFHRAAGGPVVAGKAYLVGEKGPELFSPASSGQIIPNNKLGAGGSGVTVNVSTVNHSSASVSTQKRQNADGSVSIETLIEDKIIDTLGGGRAAKVMGGRFGARVLPRRM